MGGRFQVGDLGAKSEQSLSKVQRVGPAGPGAAPLGLTQPSGALSLSSSQNHPLLPLDPEDQAQGNFFLLGSPRSEVRDRSPHWSPGLSGFPSLVIVPWWQDKIRTREDERGHRRS